MVKYNDSMASQHVMYSSMAAATIIIFNGCVMAKASSSYGSQPAPVAWLFLYDENNVIANIILSLPGGSKRKEEEEESNDSNDVSVCVCGLQYNIICKYGYVAWRMAIMTTSYNNNMCVAD